MGSGQSLLSVFTPNMRKEKRKRTDQVEKESKRQRTAVVDVAEDMIQPDAGASGWRRYKRKARTVDTDDDMVRNKRHKVNIRPEDLISLRTDEVNINQAQCVEGLNKMHDRFVDLKQDSIKERIPDWSELPNELLESILEKLIPSEFDIVGFRSIRDFKAVCQSWRAAAKSCSSSISLSRTPCLLLHEKTSSLFDPIGNKVHEMKNICDDFPNATFVGSSYGWIVMFYEDNDLNKSKAHLFNPITRAKIPIPGRHALPGKKRNSLPSKAIISSNPSLNKNFVVVVEYRGKLAYYKHGDEDMSWTKMTDKGKLRFYEGFVFHGDLLVASHRMFTSVWNFKKFPPSQCSSIKEHPRITYLMKSLTGEILRLKKTGGDKQKYENINFCVEKLNLEDSKWEIVQSLGDQSLFFFNQFNEWQLLSFTNPCFLGCKKNSIYFRTSELDKYAIYNLEKGKVESTGEDDVVIRSFSEDVHKIGFVRKPLWIAPNPW